MLAHPKTHKQVDQFIANPGQALAIEGANGAGKGYIARHIAGSIIGKSSPYIKYVDASTSSFGIEEIRQLQKFLVLTVPGSQHYKRVLIIEYIDGLSIEAQNALLKTLEEPPSDTIIIVTISNRSKVLTTIHSRLQHITILPIDLKTAEDAFGKAISSHFYLSGGSIGLLYDLQNPDTTHPLNAAITKSKDLLAADKATRISKIDTILKDKETEPQLLLDALYRLLNAGYQRALQTKTNQELQSMTQRLQLTSDAIEDLQQKVQPKLVFTRLFFEL